MSEVVTPQDFERYVLPLMRRQDEAIMSEARRRWPNLDAMPPFRQWDCISDMLLCPFDRFMEQRAAMKAHAEAYEKGLDA